MARTGTVLRVTGEHALVEAARRGVCEGCGDQARCGVDDAAGALETLVARNDAGAAPGDVVEFDLTGHAELRISLLVWIVPLVGLIAGAALGAELHERVSLGRDAATLLGALAGAAAAFAPVVVIDRRARSSPDLVPVIAKVIARGGVGEKGCIETRSCGLDAGAAQRGDWLRSSSSRSSTAFPEA